MNTYILFDIGGTKTRVARTDDRVTFKTPTIFETPQNFEEWLQKAKEVVYGITEDATIAGVLVGIPGTLKEDKITINKTPHLKEWQSIPIKTKLEDVFNATVVIENDTALVGLGEAVYGAGKGHSIVAYLTISTGVNGVRIVDRKIDRNMYGFEIGHTVIGVDKTVEYYISGGVLEERYGKPSHEVRDISLWQEVNHYAGVFGANTVMYWSPSIVVYGGPVMNDLHIQTIEMEAKKLLTMYDKHPLFVRGILKDLGGIYGALALSTSL
jgi:glucokinase